MKDKNVWVVWKYETRNRKTTKVPYQPSGAHAKSTDPTTWVSYAEAKEASTRFDGVGFCFDGGSLGIDLDHVITDGKLLPALKSFVEKANTYTEYSPSGNGLHIIFKLSEPLALKANKHTNGDGTGYECYTSGRFFTYTGKRYNNNTRRSIDSEEAEILLSDLGYPWNKAPVAPQCTETVVTSIDDSSVLDIMFASKNGDEMRAIYNGDASKYGGDVSSADIRLCNTLAFYTGKNIEQIERIWLSSPLGKRDKTQKRKDYRARTLSEAISKCEKTYSQPVPRQNIKNTDVDFICSGKNDTPVPCMSNAMQAIRNNVSVRMETFSNRMQILDKKTNKWRSYEDHDTVRIYDELSHKYTFLAKVGKANVQDAIVAIAYENEIDIAVDFIRALPEWDGTQRIDLWLEKVCGVEERKCNRQIAKNFIMGMVKRLSTREPVKFDNALILYGIQELGKSTLVCDLASTDWYLEMNSKIKDKDFFIQLQGKAIVEFSEGVTVSKADVSHIKAILSTKIDSYRPPYGRSNVDFPRRCVFAMTTNKNDVLRDETGERRWWPVHVKKPCDIQWLKNNRVQMFAEAKHRLLQGEKFWEVDKTELAEVHKDYRIEYDNEDLYVKWYKQLSESRKISGITVRDAHEGVWLIELGEEKYNPNISWSESRNIGLILRGVLGLEYRQKRDGSDRVRAFFPKDPLEGYTMTLIPEAIPEEAEEKDSAGAPCISVSEVPF